ncbi:hypothetical protein V8F20_004367 [Naviculisporaceae sp. PSN 640]
MASYPGNTTSETAPAAGSVNARAIELVAQCLCKTHTFTTQIPLQNNSEKKDDILPLEAIYCHCTSCRRSTGALYSASVVWPGSLTNSSEQNQLSELRRYKRTHESSSTGLFCPTCSTLMFYEYGHEGSIIYGAFLGCLRGYELNSEGSRTGPVTNGLVKAGHHLFLEDTKDGGAVCWMKAWGKDDGVKLWMGHRNYSEEVPLSSPLVEVKAGVHQAKLEATVPEEVAIKCHCGGVNLTLQTGASRREYLSKIEQGKQDDLPWFVNPENGKMIGTLDGCDSCTTFSGVDLFNWTFAELKYLSFPQAESADNKLKFPADAAELKKAVEENMGTTVQAPAQDGNPLGTLAFYRSSPDVQRYFCSVCSASIFYACDDRPEMVDIAIGVLCPPEQDGARAESIISWPWDRESLGNDGRNGPKTRIGWREDMLGCWKSDIVGAVEREVEGIASRYQRVVRA